MSIDGKYMGFDIENKLIMEMNMQEKKSIWNKITGGGNNEGLDSIKGGIYKLKEKQMNKFAKLKPEYWKFKGVQEEGFEEKICDINGRWTDKVFFDNECFFDIGNPEPLKILHEEFPLPSDSNYRPDLAYLRAGF